MKKIDTFSENSLRELDKSVADFEKKYSYGLSFFNKNERTELGQKFHNLICAYLRNFDVSKMLLDLNDKEQIYFKKLEDKLKNKKNNFIETEYPFLIKDELNNKPYYLTGRFDAIYKENDEYVIYDWKISNLPKTPERDLQSVVYLYSLSKIYKTEKIKIRYVSIEKLEKVEVEFLSAREYKNVIDGIISKLPYYSCVSSNNDFEI